MSNGTETNELDASPARQAPKVVALRDSLLADGPLPADILDILPGAVYVCDSVGRIVRCNQRAVELWGRTPKLGSMDERFCGSWRLYRMDGGPLPHDQCPVADVLRSGQPARDQEVVIERPDGSRVTALVNIVALRDGSGAIIGAVSCFMDITARRRAEEEQRRQQQDLEDFFENNVIALHWVGADGTILRANQAELDLLGYSREEYVGRHIADFHADRATIEEILARLARGEKLDKYPARLRAKDGSIKHVLISSNVRFQHSTRCFTVDVSELRRADAALRDNERRFHELIEALPAAIYTTDADGRITFFNRAAVEFSGRRPTLGSDEWCVSWRLYSSDGTPLPHDQCPMAIALKEGRPIRGEEAIAERPDGTRVPFMPYPTPLRDASGAIVGAVNMLVDISERKAAERIRGDLAAIVESSDDAIISTNLDATITSWNRGAEALFGYPAHEVIGHPVSILYPPDRVGEEEVILTRIRDGERVAHYETVRRRKDGDQIFVSLTVSPVRDASGKIIGASKIARDITARKRADKALRRSEERYRGLIEAVAAVVWTTDADGQVEDMPQWRTLTGQTRDEVRGAGWLNAIHPDDRALTRETWMRAVKMGAPCDTECRVRTASGVYRWYSARGVPIIADDGTPREWIGVCIDISGLKQAEEKSKLLAREVNHRANNLLTLMGAMMRQTRAESVPAFVAAMQGRISALARVQTRLARDQWNRTDLERLVSEELAPFGQDIEGRFRITGPLVPLRAQAAQVMAIIIHELATNAVKYGALSISVGRVAIQWTCSGDRLVLSWKEAGGPPTTVPSREGFGTRAISALTQQLGGEFNIEWRAEGLACRLDVPTRNLDE